MKQDGLRILYAVDGDECPQERSLEHLEGYRGSRPVRVGNGAARQRQLDIHGEVLDCYAMCSAWGREDVVSLWPHFRFLADWICEHWPKRDSGIWEVRGGERNFVYSKVMSWVALDRAVRVSERMQLEGSHERWREAAIAIRREVLGRGWSDRLAAVKQSYEDEVRRRGEPAPAARRVPPALACGASVGYHVSHGRHIEHTSRGHESANAEPEAGDTRTRWPPQPMSELRPPTPR